MKTVVVIQQVYSGPIKTVVVKQTVSNPIPIVVVKKADNPVKTIIINKGLRGEPGPAGIMSEVVDTILLSAGNMANKSFALSDTPMNPSQIVLTPVGGIVQVYGVDYVYSNGLITWSGLGLDGFLETNDYVVVRYFKESV